MNNPLEILAVALISIWGFVFISSHFAVLYFHRHSPILDRLVGQERPKSEISALIVLIVMFVVFVAVLQAALFVGVLTLELPINRLIAGAEIVAAAGWIVYLAKLPRTSSP